MASMHSASVRRRKELRDEEEDATIGKLGAAFQDTQALLISEVKYILEQQQEAGSDNKDDQSNNPIYKKTVDYIDLFSRYNSLETVRSMRADILHSNLIQHDQYDDAGNLIPDENNLQLTGFELIQLADLAISSVEEAKTLVPTLAEKDDRRLAALLDEITNARQFQTTG